MALATSLPLIYLIIRAGGASGQIWALLSRARTISILLNSALLAVAVTVSAMVIALPIAWLLERTDLAGRRFWRVVTALPLAIPTLVGGYSFVAAFGYGGVVHLWMNNLFGIHWDGGIYGFFGSWIVLTLLTFPYILLPVCSTLRSIDGAQEESARSLGHSSWSIFLRIILPNLLPSLLSGALLVAFYTLSDFAAVSLLQFDSFTRVIYVQYQASFNRHYAAILSLLLVLLAGLILGGESLLRTKRVLYRTGTGTKRAPRRVALGAWRWPALVLLTLVTMLAVGVPIGVTSYWLIDGLKHGGTLLLRWGDAQNAALVSLGAALLTVIAALPIALLSVRYRSRSTEVVEKLTYVGYALPGIVVALSLVFFGARFGGALYQTIWMLLFAYVVLFLPQSVGAIRSSLLHMSPNVENVARTLGYSPVQVWWRVTLPLIRPGLLSGGALVFLTAMKELPAALLLSPPGFRTLTTSIWGAVTEAYYTRAAAPALILVAISSVSLFFILREDARSG